MSTYFLARQLADKVAASLSMQPSLTSHWTPLYVPRDGRILLDREGYLLPPDPEAALRLCDVATADELLAEPRLAILGEPGIGKSFALRDLRDATARSGARIHFHDLRGYASDQRLVDEIFRSSRMQEWLAGDGELHLFLDSLDEGLLNIRSIASLLVDELSNLPADRLRLRVACRTGDWPAILEQSTIEQNQCFEVAPLARTGVVAQARARGVDGDAFCASLEARGVVPLAIKPLTLGLLLRVFEARGALPHSQQELYEKGTKLLCDESSLSRRASKTLATDPAQRLEVASRICAWSLLSAQPVVRLDPLASADDLAPSLDDFVGGTEFANGSPFVVDRAIISETFRSTGLFSSRGPDLLGVAHQSYAEFLTARYLVGHMTPPQIESILFHPNERGRVIPQLHQTASWVACLNDGMFARIAESDPGVLLKSDRTATAAPEQRRALVDAAMAACARAELLDTGGLRLQAFRSLAHPGLAQQLRPHTQDKSLNPVARRLAINIAEACVLPELQHAMLAIALDSEDSIYARREAVCALDAIGDDETKAQLRLLLDSNSGGLEAEEEELRGQVLRMLCPATIPLSDVWQYVRPPRDEMRLGAYYGFISALPSKLSTEDLPAALRWAAPQDSRGGSYYFSRLIDRLVRLGWGEATRTDVRAALLPCVKRRLMHHMPAFPAGDAAQAPTGDQLRVVARDLIQDTGADSSPVEAVAAGRLLGSADVVWAVEAYVAAEGAVRERWGTLVTHLAWGITDPDTLGDLIALRERHRCVAELTAEIFDAIPIDSDRAGMLRASSDRLAALSRPRPLPQFVEPFAARVHARLLKDSGDPREQWLGLIWELAFDGTRPMDMPDDVVDSPGWVELDAATQSALVDSAKRFLSSHEGTTGDWVGTRWPAVERGGLLALRLLNQRARAWLEGQNADFWERWAAAATASPVVATSSDVPLATLALRHAEEHVCRAVGLLARGSAGALPCLPSWIENVPSPAVERTLLAATWAHSSPQAAAWLQRIGLRGAMRSFEEALLSAVAGGTPEPDARERTIYLVAGGWEFTIDRLWPAMRDWMTSDPDALERVVLLAVPNFHDLPPPRAGLLSTSDLADLIAWLFLRFPQATGTAHRRGLGRPLDDVVHLRDNLLALLRDSGRQDAAEGIETIITRVPSSAVLPWQKLRARRVTLAASWNPATPREILRLATERDTRFVHSGTQLLELIVESLARLEAEFHAETPAAEEVWNQSGSSIEPKAEVFFSNRIKRHLARDLGDRHLVVNREVEVRAGIAGHMGPRTDLHVDAKAPDGAIIKVAVECKGCWHRDIDTAMKTQLVEVYLAPSSDCKHGLYIVGWYMCDKWSDSDRRKKHVHFESLADARSKLDEQAASLSREGVIVRSVVLDAALR